MWEDDNFYLFGLMSDSVYGFITIGKTTVSIYEPGIEIGDWIFDE